MISEKDKQTLIKNARKYNVSRVILFGSAGGSDAFNDIDIGVKGLAPERFFEFCWESCRDLSKPLDVIDLDKECFFNKLVEDDGVVIYG